MRLFSDAFASVDDPHLRRAAHLAELGRGTTLPNPLVGCVIARDGRVLGEGWHERAGEPHAEEVALRAAGDTARGATAYVTLEPCAHHGATPPCAIALARAGIARVVAGMPDPTPLASGGARLLEEAGVDVSFARDSAPFEELNEAWLKHLRTGLPWVTVKLALSLDGKVAGAPGVRTRMTGDGGRSVTMRLRATADAVLVGARTVAVDDPLLTVRDADGSDMTRQPLRAVLCREALPQCASMYTDGRAPTLLLVSRDRATEVALPDEVDVMEYDSAAGPRAALIVLAELGVRRVLVEPGAGLFTAFWEDGLIDEIVLVHAGGFAGSSAPGMYLGAESEDVSALPRELRAIEAGISGGEAVTLWRPTG